MPPISLADGAATPFDDFRDTFSYYFHYIITLSSTLLAEAFDAAKLMPPLAPLFA